MLARGLAALVLADAVNATAANANAASPRLMDRNQGISVSPIAYDGFVRRLINDTLHTSVPGCSITRAPAARGAARIRKRPKPARQALPSRLTCGWEAVESNLQGRGGKLQLFTSLREVVWPADRRREHLTAFSACPPSVPRCAGERLYEFSLLSFDFSVGGPRPRRASRSRGDGARRVPADGQWRALHSRRQRRCLGARTLLQRRPPGCPPRRP